MPPRSCRCTASLQAVDIYPRKAPCHPASKRPGFGSDAQPISCFFYAILPQARFVGQLAWAGPCLDATASWHVRRLSMAPTEQNPRFIVRTLTIRNREHTLLCLDLLQSSQSFSWSVELVCIFLGGILWASQQFKSADEARLANL
jgi:hypothetical protein